MEGGRFNKATLLTFKVTGILSAVPPGVLSRMVPLYTLGASPSGFTPTVKFAGAVEEVGEPVNNQLIPFATPLPVTVNESGAPLAVTATVWAAGTDCPTS